MGIMMYWGPRAFPTWEEAIEYAYAPPATGFEPCGGSGRRKVRKGQSGRWIVFGRVPPSLYRESREWVRLSGMILP